MALSGPQDRGKAAMSTTQESNAKATQGLHWRPIVLATVASAVGHVVSLALGSSQGAAYVCAVILPAITAFVTVPVPRAINRVRRVALVLMFTGAIGAVRKALTSPRAPDATQRSVLGGAGDVPTHTGLSAAASTGTAGTAHITNAWLGHVALTTAIALVPVTGTVAARNAIGHHDASTAALRPTVSVPHSFSVRAHNGTTARVIYHDVRAVDHAGHRLVPWCRPPSGTYLALGRTPVSCFATDTEGRRGEGTFIVTVERNRRPGPLSHGERQRRGRAKARPPAKTPPNNKPTEPGNGARERDPTTPGSPPTKGSGGSNPNPTTPGSSPATDPPVESAPPPAPSQQPQPLGHSQSDLSGTWLLDLRIRENGTDYHHYYNTTLLKLDDASCVFEERTPCYGGRLFYLDEAHPRCIGTFNAVNTPSFSATYLSPGVTERYDGNGTEDAAGHLRFSGTWTEETGRHRTGGFHFTRCGQSSTPRCRVRPDCMW
jgi:hypothetical protein